MMPKSLKPLAVFLVLPLLAGAAPAAEPPDPAAYRQEIEKWRAQRDESLKKEDSWLTLAGLFWLKPGENRLGSDPGKNVVILPKGKAPGVAGTFVREGDQVTLHVEPGVTLTADGQEVIPGMVLRKDTDGKPTVLKLGPLTFYLIQRGDRIGVRIKDSASAVRAAFHGLDTYPIRPEWRVVARFEPYDPPKKVAIPNVLGQVDDIPSPGAVVFEREGKTFRIDAIPGGDKGELFLIFADQTNGKETYGAGRFLDTDPPKDGKVVVDFNTAYNPPCAFTAFATCPLPPPQNKLALAIEAGEKSFQGGPAH